jgi:ribosomal protein S20
MPRIERDRELSRRRQRKVKLQKLVAKFAAATNQADKQLIAEKIRRISPFFDLAARVTALQEAKAARKAAKLAERKK